MSSSMSTSTNETMWSKMLAARQLSNTYCAISTCLSDLLHRYSERLAAENKDLSSSLLENLRQTLFSSTVSTSNAKLLTDYSQILQTVLQQNTVHTNIIQNVRRLFRSDLCLKQLFTTESNEFCQCQECDCTTSNSINDVIHDVGEIRSGLLIDPCSIPCTCFRCGDQTQQKTITFQRCSPCLALMVNKLDVHANDNLSDSQGFIYDLIYIVEFDAMSRSLVAVYQREDNEFIQVDGIDRSIPTPTIKASGKFLTLWLSRPTSNSIMTDLDTFLSPPQSTSSSIQNTTTITTTAAAVTGTTTTTTATAKADDVVLFDTPIDNDSDDNEFWNSLAQSTTSSMTTDAENTSSHTNDSVSDLYLTLLHNTTNKSSPIKSRSEHDRTVNTLAVDVLWPMILDQTNRRPLKKSTSSTTTTIGSASSISSVSTDSRQRSRNSFKQLSSTMKSRRVHPYSTST